MANQNAEQKARDRIDALLEGSGWQVQDYAHMNLSAGPVAIREFSNRHAYGKADYLLYADKPVSGVVAAEILEHLQAALVQFAALSAESAR